MALKPHATPESLCRDGIGKSFLGGLRDRARLFDARPRERVGTRQGRPAQGKGHPFKKVGRGDALSQDLVDGKAGFGIAGGYELDIGGKLGSHVTKALNVLVKIARRSSGVHFKPRANGTRSLARG